MGIEWTKCRWVWPLVALVLCGCATTPADAPAPARATRTVKLVAFNDFHGNLQTPLGGVADRDPADPAKRIVVPAGGVAHLATLVGELKAKNADTIVVGAGDIIGASPLISALFRDEPTIEAMNLVGLDYTSVGNHEFDRGKVELLRMQNGGCSPVDGCFTPAGFAGATFRYLAANVIDTSTGKPLFPPYAIRRLDGGGAIAFIGVVLKGTPSLVRPSSVEGLEFRDEADTINALLPELHAAGVDVVVVLIHQGAFTTGLYDDHRCPGVVGEILRIVPRIDPSVRLVVSGHTHQAYICDIGGRTVTSAGFYGRLVTDIDVTIDLRARTPSAIVANNIIVDPRTLAAAPPLSALVARYDAMAAPRAARRVGRITADIFYNVPNGAGETTMGDVIADAQLEATSAKDSGGAQIAFTNPGGMRASLAYRAPEGEVTYGDLFSVQPFGNSLVTMTLTGAQLRLLLEQQWLPPQDEHGRVLQPSRGFTYAWDRSRPIGSRVVEGSMRLHGLPIEPANAYRVTVNDFLADGMSYGVLKEGTGRVGGALDIDALVAFFEAHSPVAPGRRDRITRVQ
jgi:5'-nucleotidase